MKHDEIIAELETLAKLIDNKSCDTYRTSLSSVTYCSSEYVDGWEHGVEEVCDELRYEVRSLLERLKKQNDD